MSRSTRWVPVAIWATAILSLDSVPNPERLGARSPFEGADKIIHFTLYGMLGLLTRRALAPRVSGAVVVAAGAVLVAVGALDEWHQMLVPGRSADVADWVADSAGAITGILLAHSARRRREPSP